MISLFQERWNLKAGVTDYKRCSSEGLTADEVTHVIGDLQLLVAKEVHQYIDWNETRTEQGNWPTKTIVNMWFKNDTNLATTTGLLKIVKDELKQMPYNLHEQEVSARLEMSLKKKHLEKGTCLVLQRPQKQWVEMNLSFFMGSAIVAKYTPEGEGLAGEGWNSKPGDFEAICTVFSGPLFEAIVNSTGRANCWVRFRPECLFNTWLLISVNVYRQRSSDISVIKATLPFKRPSPGTSPNLELPGYVG